MNDVGKSERVTQDRVVALFSEELAFKYLGDFSERNDNSNIEEELLSSYLSKAGYSKEQINVALYKLRTEADNPNRSLYDNNFEVYQLLRYGVGAKVEAGQVTESVQLINWN